ncbi:hypothetical protein EU527_14980 [Candidatus Thorarchaeota archaeon]|nr:MAG: hypothetical protein EU527_14980 [Candidatus Thorarchaeota archaeon]
MSVIFVEDKKQLLIQLVMERNVSAIETLSNKIGLPREQVILLIKELLGEGRLEGSLTSDEKRFFKSSVKLSEAPVIESGYDEPSFLKYDVRPGLATALVGFIIILGGVVVNSFTAIQNINDISTILTFVGFSILLVGLFLIAQRKTPD